MGDKVTAMGGKPTGRPDGLNRPTGEIASPLDFNSASKVPNELNESAKYSGNGKGK